METNEFTGIDIPEEITDPEIIEYMKHLNEVLKIAYRKKIPVLYLAEVDSSNGFTLAMGCTHCISKCITRFLNSYPKAMDIVMTGVVEHIIDKKMPSDFSSTIEQLVRDAKKNAPAGN